MAGPASGAGELYLGPVDMSKTLHSFFSCSSDPGCRHVAA
jgi:hypothetical protein